MRNALFFVPALNAGGAETHAIRVANHLQAYGYRVSVAVARPGPLEDRLRPEVALHHLQPRGTRSSTLSTVRATLPLARLIRREQPHVVCSFMELAAVVAGSATRLARAGTRHVASLQSPPSRTLAFSDNHPFLFSLGLRRTLPHALESAAAVVALSRGVAGDAEAMFPALAGRLAVVHNAGYDEDLLVDQDAGRATPNAGTTVFVTCGRLVPAKDFVGLLNAFALLREGLPARLWIIGEGPLRRTLELHAERLGVRGDVEFLGFLQNPASTIRAGHVFVLSSVYEGFGNVLVEAMASGVAVISTRCPHGPEEIISDGVDGLLVPVGEPGALASAMSLLAQDASLRQRLAAAGQQRATRFHSSRIAKEYASLFDAVLACGNQAPRVA